MVRNVFGVGYHESRPPKRMLHPRAAKLLEVHAHRELINVNFLEHVGDGAWLFRVGAASFQCI